MVSGGAGARLVAALPRRRIIRIGVDLGAGIGLAVGFGAGRAAVEQGQGPWWSVLLRAAFMTLLLGGVAIGVLVGVLNRVVRVAGQWGPARGGMVRWARRVLLALLVGGVGLLLWTVARTQAHWLVAAAPAALVAVFAGWAWLLTYRQLGHAGRAWARWIPDMLAATLTGLVLLTLFSHDLLTTEPVAGLLFPVGVWGALCTWRVMTRSSRLAVRVGADIVLSLLLGVDLVLCVVWLANLLNLPSAEIAVLRGVLDRVGGLVDLPWWLWFGLYLLLAGISLAFALWPATGWSRLRSAARRMRVLPSVNAGRRVLTCAHIGLLVTVLIGVSVPTVVAEPLRAKLSARYQVAFQRELAVEGELAAYEQIRQRFSSGSQPPASVRPLVDLVGKVHQVSAPKPGQPDATGVERDLARRLGALQAAALRLGTPKPQAPMPPTTDASAAAGFDTPIGDAADVRRRISSIKDTDARSSNRTKQAERIAELAATAVASTLSIPNLGASEVVQVVREYLSGLVESGVLAKVFLGWTKPLVAPAVATKAERVVVPDPIRFEEVSMLAWISERSTVRLVNPFASDGVAARMGHEPPMDAAVDLTNEARFFQEDGSGPCAGCPRPAKPNDDIFGGTHRGPGEHPIEEPHVFVR